MGLWLNRFSLAVGLGVALALLGFRRPWLWTYNPVTATLINLKVFSRTIYHAVDAVHEQPCMPRAFIESQERRLCQNVDQVFVTSPQLERQLSPYARRIRFDPNVADQDHFASAMTVTQDAIPADLAGIPEPRVGFIGAVSSYKLDFSLIAGVARAHPAWNFVFIGPTGEGEPHTDTELLKAEPNIYLLGQRPYSSLPRYCAGFVCGWLPLRINPYTQAMFPMKFFEYLAAGLPVAASAIDALSQFSEAAWLCDPTVEAFNIALRGCLAGEGPDRATRLALAHEHTYSARTQRMLQTLECMS